jgi:23S rRNA pseudouridine2604 synthase
MIRLSKRMGELDLCSRREADRLIREGKVAVDGQVAALAEKVPPDLTKEQISILTTDDTTATNTVTTVVLHKPQGYVSGQAEHGHPPAIRLLSRDRLWESSFTRQENDDAAVLPTSWRGFAPAGRLDRHSTGLLVFSSSGIVAKKLIHHESTVQKEYIVDVEPADQVTKRERQMDPSFELPKPSLDLKPLLKGGRTLLGSEHRPLLPCVDAEWTEKGRILRMALTEGKKHHIRRVCREILGYHVVQLQRTRIGPIELGDLPEGCWRPMTQRELDVIIG